MATTAIRAPPSGLPILPAAIPPNRTLYVRDLPSDFRKEVLKRNLYMLFATYGIIIDIVVGNSAKMRGQAHIVFKDIETSTQAMRALNETEFFGKKMSIQYAKTKSELIAKLDGTFKLPEPQLPTRLLEAPSTSSAFGTVPAKAIPVNEGQGVKRGRDEEQQEENDDDSDDAEMQMSESDEE